MAGIVTLLFSYLLSQFYRSFLAVLSPVLIEELGATSTDLSNAAAAWFIVFAAMQFPIGRWLDRTGPRKTAGLLLFFCGAGGIALFASAQSPFTLIVAMALIGAGCAPVLMAAFFLFARNFSEASFATLSASFVGFGTLGNVAGTQPLAAAIEAFGWRQVGWALAVFTALVAIGILALVRDPERIETGEKRGSVLDLFRIRALWFIFPILMASYAAAASIRGLWAGPYLSDMHGLSTLEIGQVTFYMALALALGSLAYGPLDRIFGTRKWIALLGNLALLAAILVMVLAADPSILAVTLAFVAIGFFGSSYAVLMTHGKAFVPPHLTGRGITLLNFFCIGGGGVVQMASGYVVESAARNGGMAAGYEALYVFMAAVVGLALVCYAFSTDAKLLRARA
ncbi:MAG: MFS transporter [Nitratireductor sp.]|nr:MFS transporter [Nitratireductor sp.]